ncbi:MAG: GspE/PulE family protein [bacterium]|nr:GspE/PulE family protein [bacterium]
MLSLNTPKLKKLIIGEGLISAEEFDVLAVEADRKKQNLVDLLISRGFITLDYFYTLLSKSLTINRIDLKAQKIDETILNLLPQDLAQSRRVIIFNREADGTLDAAMEDPTNLNILDFLQRRLEAKIKPFLVTDAELDWGFSLYEARLAQDFRKIIEENVEASLRSHLRKEEELAVAAGELPIIAIVNNLLAYAASVQASDIHLEISEDNVVVRFRIDGILHEIIRIPKAAQPAIVARIKLLSGLRVDEHSRPQDGRFRFESSKQFIDIRVSVMPTFYGEKLEMRLLSAAQKPLSFAELGMLKDDIKILEENIKKTFGMLLVCGPTGSGKTTTLYSVLNTLNRPEVNIVTIEDPIEYNIRYVNQTQVNPAADITFANGLRAILRQDPNIIMVGEIRDVETAEIAVQSALTGHLVLSSLHTNDAPTAVPRLMDMKIPPFLVAAVLNVIVSQRLVRQIHRDCIESYIPEKEILEAIRKQLIDLGFSSENIKLPKAFYRGRGCPACNSTGYSGRMAIFEILNVTDEIRKLIVSPDFSLDAISGMAHKEGMVSMFEDGLKKIELGITTVEELMRVIRE